MGAAFDEFATPDDVADAEVLTAASVASGQLVDDDGPVVAFCVAIHGGIAY